MGERPWLASLATRMGDVSGGPEVFACNSLEDVSHKFALGLD